MIRRLHVLVFRHAPADRQAASANVDGQTWRTISITPSNHRCTLPVSFEEASRRLGELSRMFIEPDGSFVGVHEVDEQRCQVDGQLNDGPHGLVSAEFRAELTQDIWAHLLACLGGPDDAFVFQCIREGMTLDGKEFERFVWG